MIIRFLRFFLLRKKLSKVKLVVCDVDGVLTNGGLYYDAFGAIHKRFDVKDGIGIRLLQQASIEVVFLSGGRSGAIDHRARHLDIDHCFTEVKDKSIVIDHICNDKSISYDEIAFVGDDINDLCLLNKCGIFVAPSDAVKRVRSSADLVLQASGGRGALREFSEILLLSRDLHSKAYDFPWKDTN